MKTLKDLFLSELADLYDAERQIIKALPKIAKVATCSELKKLILSHFNETEENLKKIEQIFLSFGEKVKRRTCKATEGLLSEFGEIAEDFKKSPAINAALVSVAQKVDHYEVASLGCLHEWAGLLGNKEAATHLQEILNVEKTANESLTKLARALCNKEAMGSCEEKGIVKNLPLKTKPQQKPALVS